MPQASRLIYSNAEKPGTLALVNPATGWAAVIESHVVDDIKAWSSAPGFFTLVSILKQTD
jgi:hypothetical protein